MRAIDHESVGTGFGRLSQLNTALGRDHCASADGGAFIAKLLPRDWLRILVIMPIPSRR